MTTLRAYCRPPLIAVVTLALFGCAWSAVSVAQAYKYKGESGETTFSDKPPSQAQPAEVIELDSTPAAQGEDPDKLREEAREYLQQGSKESKAAEDSRKQAKAQKVERDRACDEARARLTRLTAVPPNRRLVQDADGTTRRVDADEMSATIAAAKGDVQRVCGTD